VRQGARLKVATKYTTIAREHFASKGVHVDLIKLYGSMELAPLTGLADAIVDLVSTGKTLKANHLVEVEQIMDISSRLVVNQASLKLKQAACDRIDAFARACQKAVPVMSLPPRRPCACPPPMADFEAQLRERAALVGDTDHAIETARGEILADVRARRRGGAGVHRALRRLAGAHRGRDLELTQAD
jgi:hypothetical protein